MIVLDAMDLEAERMIHGELDQHHWCKEGKHHGCRGGGRRAFVAGDVPVMLTEIEAHLPLDHRIHQ